MKTKLLFQFYRFLGRCAGKYLKKHQIFTIGINGSVGKTSCRMIVYQILEKALPELKMYTSPKNFNGELGMSLSIFQIEDWTPSIFSAIKASFHALFLLLFGKKPCDVMLLEYGIDRPGEMDFLLSIHKPNIGIFTAIDAVHSEQFGSPAEIAHEEVKMAKQTRDIVFLNRDDTYARQLQSQLGVDVLMYQTLDEDGENAIGFSQIKLVEKADQDIHVAFDLKIKDASYQIETNLLWKPNYGYIGVGITIAEILAYQLGNRELDLNALLSQPLLFQLQPGRASIFAGKRDSILLDSTYNASPISVKRLIDTAIWMQKSLPEKRKLMLVLGDMRELGDLTEVEHRQLAGYVHQSADQALLLGTYMQKYLADELEKTGFAPELLKCFNSAERLGDWVNDFLQASEEKWIVLFKGSQNTIFLEEAVKKVLKNHEDSKYLTRQSSWWLEKKRISNNE